MSCTIRVCRLPLLFLFMMVISLQAAESEDAARDIRHHGDYSYWFDQTPQSNKSDDEKNRLHGQLTAAISQWQISAELKGRAVYEYDDFMDMLHSNNKGISVSPERIRERILAIGGAQKTISIVQFQLIIQDLIKSCVQGSAVPEQLKRFGSIVNQILIHYPESIAQVLEQISSIIEADPYNPMALFVQSLIFKELNQAEASLKSFHRFVSIGDYRLFLNSGVYSIDQFYELYASLASQYFVRPTLIPLIREKNTIYNDQELAADFVSMLLFDCVSELRKIEKLPPSNFVFQVGFNAFAENTDSTSTANALKDLWMGFSGEKHTPRRSMMGKNTQAEKDFLNQQSALLTTIWDRAEYTIQSKLDATIWKDGKMKATFYRKRGDDEATRFEDLRIYTSSSGGTTVGINAAFQTDWIAATAGSRVVNLPTDGNDYSVEIQFENMKIVRRRFPFHIRISTPDKEEAVGMIGMVGVEYSDQTKVGPITSSSWKFSPDGIVQYVDDLAEQQDLNIADEGEGMGRYVPLTIEQGGYVMAELSLTFEARGSSSIVVESTADSGQITDGARKMALAFSAVVTGMALMAP